MNHSFVVSESISARKMRGTIDIKYQYETVRGRDTTIVGRVKRVESRRVCFSVFVRNLNPVCDTCLRVVSHVKYFVTGYRVKIPLYLGERVYFLFITLN